MSDPDFAWLLETFQENHPGYLAVQETCLPIVLIKEVTSVHRHEMTPEEFIPDNPFEKLLLPEPESDEQAEKD